MSHGNRKGESKANWLCSKCTGKDGKSYENHGYRDKCNMCRISKGKAHYRNVPAGVMHVGGANAGASAKSTKEEQRITKLEKLLMEANAKIKEGMASQAAQEDSDDEDGSEGQDVQQEDCTAAQLAEHRQLWIRQGKSEAHPQVMAYTERIQALQKRKLEELPEHVRIQKAEACVRVNKGKYDKARERTVAVAKQLEEAKQAEADSEKLHKQSVVDRDALYSNLGRVAQGAAPSGPGLDSVPEEVFAQAGTSKDAFLQMSAQIQQIQANLLEQQRRKKEQDIIDVQASQKSQKQDMEGVTEQGGSSAGIPPSLDLPPTQSVLITVAEALVWADGIPVAGNTEAEISANRRIAADKYIENDIKRRKKE
jgi:hypothetical protein